MKTSNILLLSAVIAIVLLIVASMFYANSIMVKIIVKGDDVIVQEKKHASTYSMVDISGKVNVIYTQDSVSSITIEADSNLHEHVKTEIVEDVLSIYVTRGVISNNIKAYITSDRLESINVTRGGHFYSESPVEFDNVALTITGGAGIELSGKFDALDVTISSGSTANLKGVCESIVVLASAGSALKAGSLITKTAEINANAGSRVELNVENSLSVNATTGSVVYYYGNPRLESVSTTVGSSIQKKD